MTLSCTISPLYVNVHGHLSARRSLPFCARNEPLALTSGRRHSLSRTSLGAAHPLGKWGKFRVQLGMATQRPEPCEVRTNASSCTDNTAPSIATAGGNYDSRMSIPVVYTRKRDLRSKKHPWLLIAFQVTVFYAVYLYLTFTEYGLFAKNNDSLIFSCMN